MKLLFIVFALAVPGLDVYCQEIGPDYRISTFETNGDPAQQATNSSIAYCSGTNKYLVVWTGTISGESEIYGQILNGNTGSPEGSPIKISNMGPSGTSAYAALDPDVAASGSEFFVVWSGDDNTAPLVDNEFEIFGQRLNGSTGALAGGRIRVSDMGPDGDANYDANAPAIVYNATGNSGSPEFLVVWSGDDNTGSLINDEFEIYIQRLSATGDGSAFANDVRISDLGPDGFLELQAFLPDVAWNSTNNQYIVVWHGDDVVTPLVDNEVEIFMQRLTSTGAETGSNDIRVSAMGANGNTSYAAFDPSIAYNSVNNNFLVVWHADHNAGSLVDNELEIYGQVVSNVGATGTTFRLSDMGPDGSATYNGVDATVQHDPNLNQFLVVWYGDDNAGTLLDNENEVYGQLVSGTGAEVGTDMRLSDAGGSGTTLYSATKPFLVYNNLMREFLVIWDADDVDLGLVDGEFEIIGQHYAVLSVEPGAQPTSPVFSAVTATALTVSFSAATGPPDGYLVIRKSGSSPTETPSDHATYTVGTAIGASTVVHVGSGLTFNETGLSSNTTYHYDLFSYNGVNLSTNYRTTAPVEGSVTTLAAEPPTQASGISFTSVGTNSLTVNFTNGNGSSRLVVAKAGTAVSSLPQDGTAYTANAAFGSGSNLGSSNFVVGSGSGPFTITGLSTATTYHFRVFEFNGSGAQSNYNTNTATTNPSSVSTLSTQPGAQPTGLTFNSITATSMNGSFTAASGPPDGYIVLRKSGSSPTDLPVDGQTYAANAIIGSSTVVFSGSGTGFGSTGLSAATTYHYDVFAFNGSGSSINYLTTSPLEGNQVTRATEPSAQPGSLTFSSITPTSMNGSFTAASGSPSGYLILRKASSSPTDLPVDGTAYTAGTDLGSSAIVAVGSSTTFSSTGLSPETPYFYDVFAYNGSGNTLNYLTSTPLEGSSSTLANEPSSQVSSLAFSAHTTTSVTLAYSPAGTPVDGYLIVRRQDTAPGGLPADGNTYTAGTSTISGDLVVYVGSATSIDQIGLSPGTHYHYAVFPFNGSGNAINYLATGSTNKGSTITLPETPALTSASAIGQTGFTAHWTNIDGAATYHLDVSADNFNTKISGYDLKPVSANTETIAGLSAGTTYQYRVRAANAIGGLSAFSDPVGVQLTVPPTPEDFNITGVGQSVLSLSWSPSQSATEYLLYVAGDLSFTQSVAGYGPKVLTGTTENIIGLTPGNSYHVKLQARNAGGGGPSPETPVLSQLLLPATPVGLDAVNVTSNSFKAKWDASHGATDYEIDVSSLNDFSTHVSGYPKLVGNTLEESVTGLPASTTFYYTVRGKNATGFSPPGNIVSVTTNANTGGAPLTVTDPLGFVPLFPIHQNSATIGAQVTGGNASKNVTLHFRPVTSTGAFSSRPMSNLSGSAWSVSVSASEMDELGLEFYVRADDGTSADQSEVHYIHKGITGASNQAVPFVAGFTGKTSSYQMFSIPYDLLDKDVENLFDVALDGRDITRWRLFHYQGGSQREYPNQFVELRLGDGYWFNTTMQDFQITLGEGMVAPVNQATPFTKTLEAGWNQIGNPFPFNISWSAAIGNSDKLGALWFFKDGAYTKSDVFKPWIGAFVHADEAMTLSIPVSAKTSASGRSSQQEMDADLDAAQWILPISIRINDLQRMGGVGMHPEARTSKDKFDEITIPRFIDYVEINSHHPEFFSPDFSRDVVPTAQEHEWTFEVESNLAEASGELSWDQSRMATTQSSLIMIDLLEGRWIDMKTTATYAFTHKPGRRLKIIYNRQGEIKPGITLLGEAYPNPFTDEVHIPLLIDKPGYRQIEVYDAFGRTVKIIGATFLKPGLHEVTWYIKEDHAAESAGGMLFYRMMGQPNKNIKRLVKR